MPGVQDIPIRWPERYDPAFFDRIFREVLAKADIRNAIAGTGISISGTPDTLATLAASDDVQALTTASLITATDESGTLPQTRLLAAGSGIVITDGGAGAPIVLEVGGVSIGQLQDITALSVLGNPTNAAGPVTTVWGEDNDTILRRVGDALDWGQITAGMFPDSMVSILSSTELDLTTALLDLHGSLTVDGPIIGHNTLTIDGTVPWIQLYETDAAADNGKWLMLANSQELSFYAFSDDLATFSRGLAFQRSGATVTATLIPEGVPLRVYDAGNTDYLQFSHDGTDATINAINTAEIVAATVGWSFTGAQTRFTGAFSAHGSGIGVEVGVAASSGYIITYDRTGAAYVPLVFEAQQIVFSTDDGGIIEAGRFTPSGTLQLTGDVGGSGYAALPGLEMGYSSGQGAGFFQAYDRGTSSYLPLSFTGSEVRAYIDGSLSLTITDTSYPAINSVGHLGLFPADNSVVIVYNPNTTAQFQVYDTAGTLYTRMYTAGGEGFVSTNASNLALSAVSGLVYVWDPSAAVRPIFRVYNQAGTDHVAMSHDGTDFRFDAVDTREMLFFESNALGGNIGVLSTGTHGNVLNVFGTTEVLYWSLYNPDGSANRRVSFYLDNVNDEWGLTQTYSTAGTPFHIRLGGSSGFTINPASGYVAVVGNYVFRVYDSSGSDYAYLTHNGSNVTLGAVNAASLFLTGAAIDLPAGEILRIRDSGSTDYVEFSHDGTDFNAAFVNTAEWNIGVSISITGSVTATGDGTFNTSDLKVKRNLVPIANALDRMRHVRGFTYEKHVAGKWETTRRAGIIAQHVELALPEAVIQKDGMRFVSDASLSGLFASSINELAERVEAIERRLAA